MLWRKIKDVDSKLLSIDVEQYKRNKDPSEPLNAAVCTQEFLEKAFQRIIRANKLVVMEKAAQADFNKEMKAQANGKNTTPAHTAADDSEPKSAKAKAKARAKVVAAETAAASSYIEEAIKAGIAAATGGKPNSGGGTHHTKAESKKPKAAEKELQENAAASGQEKINHTPILSTRVTVVRCTVPFIKLNSPVNLHVLITTMLTLP